MHKLLVVREAMFEQYGDKVKNLDVDLRAQQYILHGTAIGFR